MSDIEHADLARRLRLHPDSLLSLALGKGLPCRIVWSTGRVTVEEKNLRQWHEALAPKIETRTAVKLPALPIQRLATPGPRSRP